MKKRFFLLLALTAALLLALGMSTALATEASPDDGHEHWAWCDNPTVCAECGAAYDGPASHGVYGWEDYQADATEHWLYCKRCGIELDRGTHEYGDWQYNETEHWQACQCGVRQLIRNHFGACDNPTICAECGQPYSGSNVTHNWSDYQYNDTEHWQVCNNCGEERYRDIHLATCDNPGVCAVCGIPCDEVAHISGGYQYNETEHWEYCPRCGEELDRGEHGAWCGNRGVCAWCGASYSGDNIVHDWGDYQYNDTEHWRVCNQCGEKGYQDEHRAWCDNPGVCLQCGQPYSGDNIEHHYSSDVQYNETEHWTYCTACNEKLYVEEHWAACNNPGVCGECGQPYFGDNVQHDWDAWQWQYNETEHWAYCSLCGEEWEREAHFANCYAPNVCAFCGAPYSGDNIAHGTNSYSKFYYDETEHWKYCVSCGEEIHREEHKATCDNPGVCVDCGAPYSGDNIEHEWSDWQYTETECWRVCLRCGEKTDEGEHVAACDHPGVCYYCGQPYSGSNIGHYYDGDVGLQYQHDETNHWNVCTVCGEKYDVEAHTYGDDGVCTVCDYIKPAVTDAPTAAPTEAPTEAPTTAPTDVPTTAPTDAPTGAPTTAPTDVPTTAPTDAPTEAPTTAPTDVPTAAPTDAPTEQPTDTPHEHAWTVTAKTPATCEKEGVIAYSCACGETKLETIKALGHDFQVYVSRGDGTHRSDCTRCGTFTVKSCQMQSRTVLGVPCEVCGVCGYVHIPELDGITLPEAPMADVTAVTATGEAAAVQVFDVTALLPEDSAFALCLQVMPQEGPALPGSVRITIPCTLDTANLRLVFIPEGGLPVEVPYGVGGGMITFTVTAPGIFALAPVQE